MYLHVGNGQGIQIIQLPLVTEKSSQFLQDSSVLHYFKGSAFQHFCSLASLKAVPSLSTMKHVLNLSEHFIYSVNYAILVFSLPRLE